jgi:formylglycine-generating enzyme required for sulfatase activity
MIKLFKFWFFVLLFSISLSVGIVGVVIADKLVLSEMVLIPSGEFLMGSEESIGRPDEQPRHKVYLDAFYFDRFEVTGKDFEKYLTQNPKQHPTITGWWDRKVRPDMQNRPVFGLSWKRCNDYCEWRGKRLATEAEWERVASGLQGRKYPWGNIHPDKKRANFNRCCFIMKGLSIDVVGSYNSGATPNGIYDLAGNIAEWVYDWYDKNYYKNSVYVNPRGPENGVNHVIRGGAWNSLSGYLRSSTRYGYDDAKDFYGIGCRCAKSVKQ